MIIQVDREGSVDAFAAMVLDVAQRKEIEGLLILACDANGFTPGSIDHVLLDVPAPLFGGIFPAIIHNKTRINKGSLVVGLTEKPDIHFLRDISDPNLDHEAMMDAIAPASKEARTMFVFIDGYAQRISSFMSSLYAVFGTQYNCIGGGAGSINPEALDMGKTPCLFTNKGLIKDSAVLAMTDMDCGIGVNHGWHKISGPYRVTDSTGNAIKTIDWRPAFDVYREVIQNHSGELIQADNFFNIAKRFPFGMSRLGSEIIVRDPFTVEGESLIVATEIPPESFIDILTGNRDSLIKAAAKSRSEATETFPGNQPQFVFLIDCISRALFLDDAFSMEINAVYRHDIPLVGALTLGEIANNGTSFMELYNKTCVVGMLG